MSEKGEREGKSAVLFKGSLGLSKNKNAYPMTNLVTHEHAFEEKFCCGYFTLTNVLFFFKRHN